MKLTKYAIRVLRDKKPDEAIPLLIKQGLTGHMVKLGIWRRVRI